MLPLSPGLEAQRRPPLLAEADAWKSKSFHRPFLGPAEMAKESNFLFVHSNNVEARIRSLPSFLLRYLHQHRFRAEPVCALMPVNAWPCCYLYLISTELKGVGIIVNVVASIFMFEGPRLEGVQLNLLLRVRRAFTEDRQLSNTQARCMF